MMKLFLTAVVIMGILAMIFYGKIRAIQLNMKKNAKLLEEVKEIVKNK